MDERLHLLPAHDAILLLRHSFTIPRLLYCLRSSPCFISPCLKSYDNELRRIISRIFNIPLVENEVMWSQASLPVRFGGLGIRSTVQLAPSAFLASAAASSDLVHQILPPCLQSAPLPVCAQSH